MTLKEFDKLIKLMMMTTSPADGEVINAMRLANAILLKDNKNWEEVLRMKVTISPEAQEEERRRTQATKPMPREAHEIINALEFMLNRLKPDNSFRDFILSLSKQWEEKGWLSDRQLEVLFNAVSRHGGSSGAGWANVGDPPF